MQNWMDNDREVLARTLMAEAGNQGLLGMLAAGSVIMNRARTPGYGDGVRGVILKPGQFSPWNSVTGYAGGEQGQNMAAIQPTSEAYAIADRLLSGQYEDPTGGATHFYNPDISNPSWGQAAGGDWTRIGSHIFGRADAGRSSTGDTDMVRGGAGQTSMMGQSGADFLASEQERPRGLLGGFFGPEGRDRRARLAIALEGMTLNPNRALIGELQRGLEQRETAAQRNATVEFLRARGRSDLADAIQGGLPAADALRIAMTPVEAPTPQSAIAKLEADRRAGLITDEQYQAGLQALAPSGMTIESDGAGGFRLVQGPGAGKPLTEGQSKDTVYATRAEGALPTLDKYETALTSIGDVALGADPTGLLRGRMQSEEYQLARQAGDEFLQAILRKDTGAAITAQEQELYGQTYLPQPGDSQEVIAQKRQARRRALAAIKAGLPPSAIVAQERALQESGGALPPDGGGATRLRYNATTGQMEPVND